MFHMGGEQELAASGYYREITNSGRASLRLIIESAQLSHKRILLPGFLCEIICDVLAEYHLQVDFYSVDSTFNYHLPDNIDDYDALYLIKYFGGTTDSFHRAVAGFERCIIIDDVFSPYPETIERAAPWYSYNSLRKISAVADFSMLYSNEPLASFNDTTLEAFARLKYTAKRQKFEYLNTQIGDEQGYLELFSQAEKVLDEQKGIYRPSTQSVLAAIEFFAQLEQERSVRADNYQLIKLLLPELSVSIATSFHSFVPLLLENRDDVRCALMKDNIFLAIHWPAVAGVENVLSQSILSVPLDSRYSQDELTLLCGHIRAVAAEK